MTKSDEFPDGEVRTSEGRIRQITNIALVKFKGEPGKLTEFMSTPHPDCGNKTPSETAGESFEGYLKVLNLLKIDM